MGAAICRFGGVGDNLVAASVLPLLKEKYGRVDVLSREPFSDVFKNNPYVDRLILPDMKSIPDPAVEWQRWFQARGKEYDFLVNLSHSLEVCGGLQEAQTQFYWPQEYRRKWAGGSYIERTHDICGVEHKFKPLYYPTDEELEKADDVKAVIGGDYIVWVLSGTRLDKVYPQAALAIARLIKEVGPVVAVGVPGKQFDQAKAILEACIELNGTHKGYHLALSPNIQQMDPYGKMVDVKPTWPLRRSLATACRAQVVVGPDTGVMWATAFEQMGKVVLLSHASPENITKHWINTKTLHADQKRVDCWPCHRLHDDKSTCRPNKDDNGAACISDISVETVVQAVKEAWQT